MVIHKSEIVSDIRKESREFAITVSNSKMWFNSYQQLYVTQILLRHDFWRVCMLAQYNIWLTQTGLETLFSENDYDISLGIPLFPEELISFPHMMLFSFTNFCRWKT